MPSLLQRRRSPEANQTSHDVWSSPGLVHYIYIFGGSCPLTKFCPVQNSLYVQVLHSPILAALLHGTPAAGISQTLRCGTRNGITELLQRAPPVFGRAAITLGISPHSSFLSTVYWFRSLILLSVHSSTAILSLHAVNEEICSFSTPRIKGSHYTLAFSFANCIAE